MSMKGFFFGWLKVLVLITGLFILGFLSALITMNMVIQGEQVKVPALTGKNIVAALQETNSLRLNLKIEGQEFDRHLPPNTILSQKPEAGKLIKSGRTIRVILSKGTSMMAVPDLAGESLSEGQTLLQKHGLKVGRIAKVYHHSVGKDMVISQNPLPDSHIPQGGLVNLLVSQGPEPLYYHMPELHGKSLDEAEIMLRELGLKTGPVHYKFHEEAEPDIITEQAPKAGYRISPQDEVTLYVNKEEPTNEITEEAEEKSWSEPESIEEETCRYTVLVYTVPSSPGRKRVQIILQEGEGKKEILNEEKEPEAKIELLVKVTPRTVALIYVDGNLVKEEQFQ